MTNTDRAAEVLWLPEPHLSGSECDDQARELAQALADAGGPVVTGTYTMQIREPGDRGQLPIVAGWYPVRKNLHTEAAARWAAVNITRTRPASEPDRFFRILGHTGEAISL